MTIRFKLFKIFYNDATRAMIGPPFVPLDNCNGPKEWVELWPILHHLESNDLEPDTWYGFFSPKFPDKVELTAEAVLDLLRRNPHADVALFTSFWTWIVRYRNGFVQGDVNHPGLIACMEGFLRSRGEALDLRSLPGDFSTTVFSNYVIAKAPYWRAWQSLARAYLDYVEAGAPDLPDRHRVRYDNALSYPMQAFVQERLALLVLNRNRFLTVHPDYLADGSLAQLGATRESKIMRAAIRLSAWAKARKLWLLHRAAFTTLLVIGRLARRRQGK